MGRIEDLSERYKRFISLPWQRNLSGDQKTVFIVYPKQDERRLRVRLELFEMATKEAGHTWISLDLTKCFAKWMSQQEYKELYFEDPESLRMKLDSDFLTTVAEEFRHVLTLPEADENTVIAVHGVGSLFGLSRLSLVLKQIVDEIRGRLVLFFPGSYENNNYRLLDARDGLSYLAVPITLHDGENA
jgi:hypothetical protein